MEETCEYCEAKKKVKGETVVMLCMRSKVRLIVLHVPLSELFANIVLPQTK